jgi:hypothetical protein
VVTSEALGIIEELDHVVFAATAETGQAHTRRQTEALLAHLKSCLPTEPSIQARLRRIDELVTTSFDGSMLASRGARSLGGLLLEIVALKMSLQRFAEA